MRCENIKSEVHSLIDETVSAGERNFANHIHTCLTKVNKGHKKGVNDPNICNELPNTSAISARYITNLAPTAASGTRNCIYVSRFYINLDPLISIHMCFLLRVVSKSRFSYMNFYTFSRVRTSFKVFKKLSLRCGKVLIK